MAHGKSTLRGEPMQKIVTPQANGCSLVNSSTLNTSVTGDDRFIQGRIFQHQTVFYL